MSYDDLRNLAKANPPPQSWWDEDVSGLIGEEVRIRNEIRETDRRIETANDRRSRGILAFLWFSL